VSFTAPVPEGERPYFKVPESGRFDFTLGDASGTIEAVDYVARGYRELTARDAAGLVANLRPFVLDVRTEREFAEGHLEGATLIPIQVLQKRINELDPVPRDRPVLVYCRSGNRSTVAAKMLLDAGFEQVYNIRRGIREWNSEGLPTVR
jgi:rhodanese-related sulfurtransferase